ncbi:hypothetical protein ILUMI_11390 [Ignelater luminosus]|uniref:Uncharacterized protein n=1 Tax=Ignelater luminosus TaxID=2038154 RepID=A0A8K0CW62_IGNLU|nr:hypothetical protein ILUMI_11390 [Ignelater luminosus]
MKVYTCLYLFALHLLLLPNFNNAQQVVIAENSNISSDPFLDYEDYDQDFSHVGCLKYHFKEEKIPKLLSEVCMYNMKCPTTNCEVSLIDVVEATQLSRFNTTALVEGIEKLNISENDAYNICLIYDLTADLFEYLLQTFGLTFSDIYKNFVSSLANPSQSIPEILNTLNVSALEFMNAQAYGNDTLRLRVLSYGNYSKENMLTVLKIANKTPSDMLRLIPLNQVARQIKKLNPTEFTNFIKNIGVTSKGLEVFYEYLGIKPINFLSYPAFIQIITSFYDSINPQEVLATLISPTRLVTSNTAQALSVFGKTDDVLVSEYSNLDFELVENPLVQYLIKNVILNNTEYQSEDIAFIDIKNPISTGYVEMFTSDNLTMLNNYTYVSKLQYGGLYVENVTNAYRQNHTIVITKTANTVYNLGSPLFCQGKLCGFASGQDAKSIRFSTFIKKMPSTIKPKPTIPSIIGQPSSNGSINVTHPTVASKPSNASALFVFNILNIILGFVIIKLLL